MPRASDDVAQVLLDLVGSVFVLAAYLQRAFVPTYGVRPRVWTQKHRCEAGPLDLGEGDFASLVSGVA